MKKKLSTISGLAGLTIIKSTTFKRTEVPQENIEDFTELLLEDLSNELLTYLHPTAIDQIKSKIQQKYFGAVA